MATNREKVLQYAEESLQQGLPEGNVFLGEARDPECGDLMQIGFTTTGDVIAKIGFTITETACPPVKACAAAMCRLAKKKPVISAFLIEEKDLAELLTDNGELSPEHRHCAIMAEMAMKRAISAFLSSRKNN